jgi:hypothetical protein
MCFPEELPEEVEHIVFASAGEMPAEGVLQIPGRRHVRGRSSWFGRLGSFLGFTVKVTVTLLISQLTLYYLPDGLDVISSQILWMRSSSQMLHTLVFDGAKLLYRLTPEQKTMILDFHTKGEICDKIDSEVRNSLNTEIETLRGKISDNTNSYLKLDGEHNQCKTDLFWCKNWWYQKT